MAETARYYLLLDVPREGFAASCTRFIDLLGRVDDPDDEDEYPDPDEDWDEDWDDEPWDGPDDGWDTDPAESSDQCAGRDGSPHEDD